MHYVHRWRAEPDRSRRSFPCDRSRRHDEDVQVDDVRPRREWEALVEDAAHACRNGALEKVVLARAVRARARAPFDPVVALERLRDAYPNAYVFAVARGPRCFLGATPERLVRLRDGTVDATCLAGSAPRGETPEEDARLGSALLASAKDRAEHAIVVRSVRAALEGVCSEVHSPDEPRLLRLRNVQHLYTPVDGHVSWPTCVLDLVQRLHPTPAVGGYPREEALRFIREREGLDRGWYAGPVGWLDRRGDGEFAVALRSALLHGAEATLFAGSGIVAQSRAPDEYAETCLKLRPMLNALGTEAVGGKR
jgi:isochorismate synthase